jgi:RNA polymerase sigma-70 factor (ECF subfamily)
LDDERRGRAKDEAAFQQMAEALWPRLYRLVYRYLNDAAEAEDVAQDALVKAWERLPAFRGESRLETWVMAIALNVARNARRRRRRYETAARASTVEDVPTVVTPEGVVLEREEWEALHRALNALPPDWRVGLELVAVQELSYAEASRVLAVPETTLRNWIHRARLRLRDALGYSKANGRPSHGQTSRR